MTWLKKWLASAEIGGLLSSSLLAGGCCFGGETWVSTPRGRQRIRDVRVGDWVLSFDVAEARLVERQVTRVFRHGPRSVAQVDVGAFRIRSVTANHPIFDENSGDFLPVGTLIRGARSSLTLRSDHAGCRQLAKAKIATVHPARFESECVFNLSVAETQTYIADGVVVHNKGDVASCDQYELTAEQQAACTGSSTGSMPPLSERASEPDSRDGAAGGQGGSSNLGGSDNGGGGIGGSDGS